jgi:hypothetical protein
MSHFPERGGLVYDDANMMCSPHALKKLEKIVSVLSTFNLLSNKFYASAVCIVHLVHYLPQMKFIKTVVLLTSVSASAAFAPSRNTNLPHTQTTTSLDMGITLYGSQGSR